VTEKDWLVDETQPLSKDEAREVARGEFGFQTPGAEVPIAVSLHDVTIHNTRVWFNRPAEVRIDALMVSPTTEESIFHPATYEFSGVQDGQRLPIDKSGGVGLYLGRPKYLLDIALIASQGGPKNGEIKTLGELLAENADNLGDLLGNVTTLAAAAPQAAAVTGAAAAAAKLSAAALRLLDQWTGKSIGLYRATWWEHRNQFGLGPHPEDGGHFRERDFEFRYEIFRDSPATP
jgi:hypothetical protein